MDKRSVIKALAAAPLALGLHKAGAQGTPFKIGFLAPLYCFGGGELEVAGRKVELILKDDTGVPDMTKRLAQELVVNDKVDVLAGFGLTPLALATGPIATQSKTPMVNMLAATSAVIDASPYMVRVSMTLPQITLGIADWAPKNGIKKVVTLVSDYGPGLDAERTFKDRFLFNGGQILDTLRVPVRSPDFAPFLQKVRDARPDATRRASA